MGNKTVVDFGGGGVDPEHAPAQSIACSKGGGGIRVHFEIDLTRRSLPTLGDTRSKGPPVRGCAGEPYQRGHVQSEQVVFITKLQRSHLTWRAPTPFESLQTTCITSSLGSNKRTAQTTSTRRKPYFAQCSKWDVVLYAKTEPC